MEKTEIKHKIRNIKLYRDQIKFIKEINFKGKNHFKNGCLVVKGHLDCSDNQLTSLPDNLVVKGHLNCSHNQLTSLPDNLVVKGGLFCNNNQLASLPNNLIVKGSLYCGYNKVKLKLPKDAKIGGKFYA